MNDAAVRSKKRGAVLDQLLEHPDPVGVEHADHRGRLRRRLARGRRRSTTGRGGRSAQVRSARSTSRGVDGLGEVVVHAGLEAALALALQRGGGHRDDRHPLAGGLVRADLPGRVEAVEPRHPAVHEHHGVPVRPGQPLDGGDPVVGEVDGAAQVLQQAGRDHLVDRVVLDDEHPYAEVRAGARPAGRGAGSGRGASTPSERVVQLDLAHRLARGWCGSRRPRPAGGAPGRS